VKYFLLSLLIFILTFLVSCQKHEKNDSPTFTVIKTDFEDNLNVDGLIESVQTTTLLCPQFVDGVIFYIVDDGAYVKTGDIVCILEDKEIKKSYNEGLTFLETVKAGLNKSKADLDLQYSLLEAQVKNNAAETAIANLDSLQLQYLTPIQKKIKELELEKVAIEKQKLGKKLKSLAIINQSEINKLQMQIQSYTFMIQSSKERIDALTIKATQSGLVKRAIYQITNKLLQVGDPVWNNMPLVIMPDLTKMKVKILASEGNYKRISIKDSVYITLDAMPKNKAWGKILSKSPVGQSISRESKVKFFEIQSSIDSSLTIPSPGLSSNCKVILKRVNDTIVIPQIAIFEQESMKVVYVKKADKYEMRQVLTGSSSPKSAVIVTGLKVNEKISLIKPKASLIDKKTYLSKLALKKYSTIK